MAHAYSTSTIELSSLRTIIFATTAGASGRRSWHMVMNVTTRGEVALAHLVTKAAHASANGMLYHFEGVVSVAMRGEDT